MSIFPAKILVATDASKEAQLAASTAAELSARTDSELHIIHVGGCRSSTTPRDTADTTLTTKRLRARLENFWRLRWRR